MGLESLSFVSVGIKSPISSVDYSRLAINPPDWSLNFTPHNHSRKKSSSTDRGYDLYDEYDLSYSGSNGANRRKNTHGLLTKPL